MQLKKYYFLLPLLLPAIMCVSCREQDLPHASKLYLISSGDSHAAARRFDKCVIHYAFVNSAKGFDVNSAAKSLEEPFDYWEAAAGYINFIKVTSSERPDIRFVFSDTTQFSGAEFDQGLVIQQTPELSKFIAGSDGTYTVLLNNSFRWDLPTLQRVLLFQIGTALGLPASRVVGSAMSPKLWIPIIHDSTDVVTLRRLYDQPCDEWVKLDSIPFRMFLHTYAFSVKGKGYVVSDADWSTWEYDPNANDWQQRKPFPFLYPLWVKTTISSFVIGDHAYFGADYVTGGAARQYWRYTPATTSEPDRWDTIAPLPNKSSGSSGLGFGIGQLGYVYTAVLEPNGAGQAWTRDNGLWVYDPKSDAWTLPGQYINPTGTDNDLRDHRAVAVGNRAFIVSPGTAANFLFDPAKPSSPWGLVPPTMATSYTSYIFAARDSPYMISGWFDPPKNVRRYGASGIWTALKDMNANGRIMFSFTINDRVYIATDQDEFWTYRP